MTIIVDRWELNRSNLVIEQHMYNYDILISISLIHFNEEVNNRANWILMDFNT